MAEDWPQASIPRLPVEKNFNPLEIRWLKVNV
jgi:hypothetical protein